MANSIMQLKRSVTASVTPSALVEGELAINLADLRLFVGPVGGGAGVDLLSAANVTYDNSTSGYTATDVQDALDEMKAEVDTKASTAAIPADTADTTGDIFTGEMVFKDNIVLQYPSASTPNYFEFKDENGTLRSRMYWDYSTDQFVIEHMNPTGTAVVSSTRHGSNGAVAVSTHSGAGSFTYNGVEVATVNDIGGSGGLGGSAQSWTDVTASRDVQITPGTNVYQNTTGEPIAVSVVLTDVDGSAVLSTSDDNITFVGMSQFTVSSTDLDSTTFTLFGIVPNNWYYRVTASSPPPTLDSWRELR